MVGTQPTFLIPGVSRAGTTTLYEYLSEHPDIFIPSQKELRFFDRDENYQRGLDYYEGQFRGHRDQTAIGEVSPPYFYRGITFNKERKFNFDVEDDPPTRIYDAYPNVKIILTLRNPISRAYSQYWKNVRQGRERLYPFDRAIKSEINGDRHHRETAMCWYYKNRYSTHLQQWLDLFDESQILILIFEEWIKDPPSSLNRICRFLGVDQLGQWGNTNRQENKTKTPKNLRINEIYHDYLQWTGIGEIIYYFNLQTGYPDMPEETKQYLYENFHSEINFVEKVMNRELDTWRERFEIN